MRKTNLILALILTLTAIGSAKAQISSVYTNLTKPNCRTTEMNKETGSSVQKCRGFDNWSLIILDDDDRMSINVAAPDEKKYELNFWSVVTTAFSSLGNKAEWRVRKDENGITPIALIVRVNATSEATGRRARQSYLTVSKITDGEICVVEKISSQKNANQMAHTSADNSAGKPCLQPE